MAWPPPPRFDQILQFAFAYFQICESRMKNIYLRRRFIKKSRDAALFWKLNLVWMSEAQIFFAL